MGVSPRSSGGAEMFGLSDFFGSLGGLLGFGNATPSPEALNVAGASYQGAEANPGRTAFPLPRVDQFARFTPEQRQQMGYGAIADAFMQMGGRQGTALNSMMNAFDTQAGRTPTKQVAPQQEPQMQPVPMIQMPPVTMPQMRPMALNIPSRTAYRVPSLLGI